jgi:hypothetical protein
LNSALGPERIQSARDAEPGLRTDVPFIDLSVIADRADGARGPVLGNAQLLAKFAFGADQPPDIGVSTTESENSQLVGFRESIMETIPI